MSIRIDLTKEKEKMLEEEAKRHGMNAADYARMLLEKNLHASSTGASLKMGMFPELQAITEKDFEAAKHQVRDFEP